MSGIFIAILAVSLLTFMPESWHKRMEGISDYKEDGSAMGRINAWKYAYTPRGHNCGK
jgi:hypothetical protein